MPSDARNQAPQVEWGQPRGSRYSLAELVARTSVPSSSVHHYRRVGLIPDPTRLAPNRFVYDDRHVAALLIVRSLRRRGRALDDIRRALPTLFSDDIDGLECAIDSYAAVSDDTSTRARLIDAAIGAFAGQGYNDVSVNELCDRAGVAKGTFYRHFETKDGLFVAAAGTVVERAISDFAADIDAGVATEHAALFSGHLREGLPVLLELAKRSVQTSGAMAHDAAQLFYGLAERLGQVVGADDPAQAGGFVIMLAVVDIFLELVEAEVPEATSVAPSGPSLRP